MSFLVAFFDELGQLHEEDFLMPVYSWQELHSAGLKLNQMDACESSATAGYLDGMSPSQKLQRISFKSYTTHEIARIYE